MIYFPRYFIVCITYQPPLISYKVVWSSYLRDPMIYSELFIKYMLKILVKIQTKNI